jgi:hypothetical protein
MFEFAKSKNLELYKWSIHLLNWHANTEARKQEIYDAECCHELNTFLKFKDPPFFNAVVAPFIRNKINKTIVDLCLLEDDRVNSYTEFNKYRSLNAF